MSRIFLIAATGIALAAASSASAQSLKLKEMAAHDREQVANLARQTNAACGTHIVFQVDYASYSHVLDDENNQNPWAYVANVTDALKHVCQSDAGKQSVAAKIRTVTVSNGAAESESLSSGAFHYIVPYAGHSPQTVIAWFEANL